MNIVTLQIISFGRKKVYYISRHEAACFLEIRGEVRADTVDRGDLDLNLPN
jgi:hypothetical protein